MSSSPQPICEESRAYFHDYPDELARNDIPQQNLDHINACPFCLAEIDRLKGVLSECSEDEHERNFLIGRTLELHFASIDKPVDCQTVKLFLPTLADPEIPVCVPTPITVHIDHCIQCSKDLETIRNLQLSSKQLYQLGQIFAEKSSNDQNICNHATSFIEMIGKMVFKDVPQDVLNHCCICPACRQLMHCHRHILIHRLKETVSVCQHPFCSGDNTAELAPEDIFTYCFPHGFDPANDEYASFRLAYTSHASTCIASLEKMQQLHIMINDMLVRENSGVVTLLRLSDRAKAKDGYDENDIYAGQPLEVEVLGKSEIIDRPESMQFSPDDRSGTQMPDRQHTLTRKVTKTGSHTRLKRGWIPAAVAAMLFILVGLFFNTSTAKAVTLEQVFNAITKIKNVCVTRFATGQSKSSHKEWVSQSMSIKLFELPNLFVLWDVNKGQKWHCDRACETISITTMPDDMLAKAKKSIDRSFGLLPFLDISDVPPNASWTKLDKASLNKSLLTDIEVYDLAWTVATDTTTIEYRKWRVFVDVQTNLPKKTERFFKTDQEGEYVHETTIIVKYPDENTVMAAIKDVFGEFGQGEKKSQLLNN